MQKNTQQNLLLLIIVALLASSVFFLNEKRKADQELRLPININALNSITIQHSNKIRIEKRNDQWHMVWPQQGQVKADRIDKMLTYLKLPLEGGFDAKAPELNLYGLEQPRMQVKLNDATLAFGMLNTMEQMHYIQFQDKIYLARPFLQISFDRSVADLLLSNEEEAGSEN